MNIEKFLFKKISIWILLLVIVFSFVLAILFGSLVLRSSTAKKIALIPNTLNEVFFKSEDVFLASSNRFGSQSGFIKISNKPDDLKGYLLLARYDAEKKRSLVELVEVKSGKILHTWKPDINKINTFSKLPKKINLKRDNSINRYQMYHPVLLSNGDLITHSLDTPLIRISACSELIWFSDKPFHHSIELDHDGNIWSPAINFPPKVKGMNIDLNRRDGQIFRNDTIEKISYNGKSLFSKSLVQIFIDNNLEKLIFPVGNEYGNHNDPFHLNDIQPVLNDSKFWKRGDIFMSLKQISLVLLYRPSTNKIIWHKQGPWVYQHDVDVINDHQIAVFDNNRDDFLKSEVKDSNEILVYDFEKDEIFSPYQIGFVKNKIKTSDQGLSEILSNGDAFIEETNYGRILRMDKNGKIKWQYINRAKNLKIYRTSWSRFLEENLYYSIVEKIANVNCE